MIHLFVLGSIYFLPTILAVHRGHGVMGILLLNLFFGWTGIGWIAMLLWAWLSVPPYGFPLPQGYTRPSGWYR